MKPSLRFPSWQCADLHTRRPNGPETPEYVVSYEARGAFAQLVVGTTSYEAALLPRNAWERAGRMKLSLRFPSWRRADLHTRWPNGPETP